MGYVDLILPNVNKEYYYVSDIVGNMLNLYQLKTGDIKKIKIRANTMKNNSFEKDDIIKITEIKNEKKWIKNSDGSWERADEYEDILSQYIVLKK